MFGVNTIGTGFQSTPPAWGATKGVWLWLLVTMISIHAPREGGDWRRPRLCAGQRVISIHAPREGGDASVYGDIVASDGISIHAPREGGDGSDNGAGVTRLISIHAPREGGDR